MLRFIAEIFNSALRAVISAIQIFFAFQNYTFFGDLSFGKHTFTADKKIDAHKRVYSRNNDA
jgi:hypothetical protein